LFFRLLDRVPHPVMALTAGSSQFFCMRPEFNRSKLRGLQQVYPSARVN